MDMYYLIKLMLVRNSTALVGWFWPMVSHELAIGMLTRAVVNERLGAEDPIPMCLTHMAHKSLLTIGRKPQFPTGWISHRAAWVPSSMAAGFLQSEWSQREQGGNRSVFYDPDSEVILSFLHNCSGHTSQQVISIYYRKGPHKRGYQEAGVIMEIGYHTSRSTLSYFSQKPKLLSVFFL